MLNIFINPKLKAQNTKQIQNPKVEFLKHLNFLSNCLGFRYSHFVLGLRVKAALASLREAFRRGLF